MQPQNRLRSAASSVICSRCTSVLSVNHSRVASRWRFLIDFSYSCNEITKDLKFKYSANVEMAFSQILQQFLDQKPNQNERNFLELHVFICYLSNFDKIRWHAHFEKFLFSYCCIIEHHFFGITYMCSIFRNSFFSYWPMQWKEQKILIQYQNIGSTEYQKNYMFK